MVDLGEQGGGVRALGTPGAVGEDLTIIEGKRTLPARSINSEEWQISLSTG